MLSLIYPSLLSSLRQLGYGLMPVFHEPAGTGALALKLPKAAILTARMRNEVKVYLLSDGEGPATHLGLITAFFEDEDEPLMIATTLFSGDDLLPDIVSVLGQPEFDIYFFDEHDREWLGVRAINSDVDRWRREFETATFAPFDPATCGELVERLKYRFSVRDGNDDCLAFTMMLGERLYPDNLLILDFRPAAYQFREAQSRPAVAQLIREDPGPLNERDIALLLSRAFPTNAVILNPIRSDTARELTDVLVVTERVMLFVEAKDSPNTAASLNRSIDRKRKTIQNQVKKATKQLQGGLSYAQAHNGITIESSDGPRTITLDGRQLLGLIVVQEMFDDDQSENSKIIFDLIQYLRVPVMLIDYAGLHMVSFNLRTPERFIDALHALFESAIEHRRFPRSVWNGPPAIE